MWNSIKDVFGNVEVITIAITIIVAVVGWIISLVLQNRQIKKQQQIQVKYDIYKQFVKKHQEAQSFISMLCAKTLPPFIQMESSMTPFELGLTKSHKGVQVPYSEQICLLEAEKKWRDFVYELQSLNGKFFASFLDILYITEDWAAAIVSILPIKEHLKNEVQRLRGRAWQNMTELSRFAEQYGYDWRAWDQDKAREITNQIQIDMYDVGALLNDFMVLVHNELLADYFDYRRPVRQSLDPERKVLTKDGVVENVDWETKEKYDNWTKLLKNEHPEFLEEDKCKECGHKAWVIDLEETAETKVFSLGCGDKITVAVSRAKL